MKSQKRLQIGFFILFSVTACGGTGSVDVEGEIGGYSFDLNTVFGWIDEKEADSDDGRTIFKNREFRRLRVHMTGASFDPTEDYRFRDATDRLQDAREEALKGKIDLTVSEYDLVQNGETLREPPAKTGDESRVSVDYAFGAMELDEDAEYPGESFGFGRKFTAELLLKTAGRSAGEEVEGKLTLSLQRSDDDPVSARVGNITIEFEAPLISERVAECNASESPTACELTPR